MDVWLACFLAALLASVSATEIVRVAAVRLSAVDHPGGRRVHRRPTPRLGGLGVLWGFGVALTLMTHGGSGWGAATGSGPDLLVLLAGGALLIGVGLVDDVHGLPWAPKLVAGAAAGLILYAGGWRVVSLGLPGLGAHPVGAWSLPLTIGWVVLVTNALNLIDGLDGLASGVALVSSLAACALLGAASGPERYAAVALAGALLGFMWFNLHPALVFLGDAGSLFVGFLLSAVLLRIGRGEMADAFPLVPALLFAVPLADTLYALARRGLGAARCSRSPAQFLREARRRLFAPDRGHVHHLLLQVGLSPRTAVALLWGAAVSLALSGCVMARHRFSGLALTLVVTAAWSYAYRRLGRQTARREAVAAPRLPALDAVARPRAAPRGRVRVVVLVNDLAAGGAQRVALEQATALDPERFEVEIASLELKPEHGWAAGRAGGLPVRRIRPPRLVCYLREFRPHVVHAHLLVAGAAGVLAARAAGGARVVTTFHNLTDWEEKAWHPVRLLARPLLERCDAVVAITEAVRAAMARVSPRLARRAVVIHNGADLASFRGVRAARVASRSRLGYEPGAFVVGAVARLDPRKGVDLLLDATARACGRLANLQVLIVGDGPERARLEAQARALGLEARVRLAGEQRDVRPFLAALDLFAAPSRTEGQGVAIVEALAAGIPVVAARVGGIPEVLGEGEYGWLAPPGDPGAWAEALVRAATTPAELERLAAKGPTGARRFSIETSRARLEELYLELLDAAPASESRLAA